MQNFSISERGRRQENQDFVLSVSLNQNCSVYIIADGMGGYEQGAFAAQLISESFVNYVKINIRSTPKIETLIIDALEKCNEEIACNSQKMSVKMGATIAGIIIIDNIAYCFWLGDVRIYHLRKDKIIFQTMDHSLVNEVKQNFALLTPNSIDQYKNIVLKSIQGKNEHILPDIVVRNVEDNDVFFICSDGVHSAIKSGDIESIVLIEDEQQFKCVIDGLVSQVSNDNYSAQYIICTK